MMIFITIALLFEWIYDDYFQNQLFVIKKYFKLMYTTFIIMNPNFYFYFKEKMLINNVNS